MPRGRSDVVRRGGSSVVRRGGSGVVRRCRSGVVVGCGRDGLRGGSGVNWRGGARCSAVGRFGAMLLTAWFSIIALAGTAFVGVATAARVGGDGFVVDTEAIGGKSRILVVVDSTATTAGDDSGASGNSDSEGALTAEPVDPGVLVGDIVMPAVVQIVTIVEFEQRLIAYHESRLVRGELIREEGEWEQFTARVTGSGAVIYSDTAFIDGVHRDVTYILTNHHVIDDALPERWGETFAQYHPEHVRVENWQQRLLAGAPEVAEVRILSARLGIVVVPEQNFWIPAEVEMYDEQLDVALVRVEGVRGMPFVRLGDSDGARVGETLYMAGAPMGLPFQITSGRLGQKGLNLDPMWRDMWRYCYSA